MERMLMFSRLFVTVTLLSTACGAKGSGGNGQQPITPAAEPNPPDPSINPDTRHVLPDSGFYYKDLLRSYCSVTMSTATNTSGDPIPAGTGLLISDIGENDDLNLYFPDQEDRDVGAVGSVLVSSIANASCALDKARDEQGTTVVLAAVKLYASDDRAGPPICTLAPGPLSTDDFNVASYGGRHSWEIEIPDSLKITCGGAVWGYSENSPNYLTLFKSIK